MLRLERVVGRDTTIVCELMCFSYIVYLSTATVRRGPIRMLDAVFLCVGERRYLIMPECPNRSGG